MDSEVNSWWKVVRKFRKLMQEGCECQYPRAPVKNSFNQSDASQKPVWKFAKLQSETSLKMLIGFRGLISGGKSKKTNEHRHSKVSQKYHKKTKVRLSNQAVTLGLVASGQSYQSETSQKASQKPVGVAIAVLAKVLGQRQHQSMFRDKEVGLVFLWMPSVLALAPPSLALVGVDKDSEPVRIRKITSQRPVWSFERSGSQDHAEDHSVLAVVPA